MQVLERDQQLGRIEPTSDLIELSFPLQMMEELSSVNKSKHNVQLLGRLERKLKRHDERVVHLGQHRSFGQGVDDF